MAILLPQRFHYQPQYAAPIDYNGLAKGVQVLFNPAVGPVDLVTGRIWTPSGDLTIADVERGKVFKYPGVNGGLDYTGYPELVGNVGTFFTWCPTVGPSDDFGHVLFGNSTPNQTWYQITAFGFVRVMGQEGAGATITWANTNDRSLVFSSGGSAATIKAYLDGKNIGATWSSTPNAWPSGNKNLSLGRYLGATTIDFSGRIRIAGFTTAVWGEAEARAFHANPWQMFKAQPRRIWTVSSGGDTVTGTVDYTNVDDTSSATGTTTVTGSSATTNTNDTSSASGTTTVTGSSATTNVNDTSAATGSPVVVGTSATTNADDTSSASGSVGSSVVGSVAYTNVDDVSAAEGTTTVVGSAAVANADDVSSVSGTTTVIGTSATTNANDICAASGTVEAVEITGTVAVTNADDVSAASGTTTIVGSSATTNTNDAISAYGVVNNGTIVEAALTTGTATTVRIKKPGIPVGTPDWLRTMWEIVIGRRGNKIEIPKFQTLEFSATPTQAELEALYAYTNKVRDALDQLINRLDS